nr:AMP-binding protein [uncultured Dongia sp.]
MSNALKSLSHWAELRPDDIAVRTEAGAIDYRSLQQMVADAAIVLTAMPSRRCAVLLDNGLAWIVADLALRQVGCVAVPIPSYFTEAQTDHVLGRAGVDLIITDAPERLSADCRATLWQSQHTLGAHAELRRAHLFQLRQYVVGAQPPLPTGARKLTFTSGTTGQPKGVCLSDATIDQVAHSLLVATEGSAQDRHLSLLPYPALLENIAGIDVSLMAGAEINALPLASLGFTGSSGLAPQQLVAALDRYRPTSIVTVPQFLQVLVAMAHRAGWRPDYLRHVAVGGAALPEGAVQRARDLGLPVFEGYGLSECGSVVTLNTRTYNRPGSVGRVLPHCTLTLAEDGEVMVAGPNAVGYLEADGKVSMLPAGPVATGDIGRLDADGYLYLLGRKKNMFITAFGRNVAPDWVECELSAMPTIAQAIVFGEARPWNAAVIVPRPEILAQGTAVWRERVAVDIDQVNARLPDYARVRHWLVADQPFLPANGLLTWNGRLRREQIAVIYQERLDRLYQEELSDVS